MSLLKMRKFWLAVGGVLAVAVSQYLGVEEAKVNEIVAIVVSLILGIGMADLGKNASK